MGLNLPGRKVSSERARSEDGVRLTACSTRGEKHVVRAGAVGTECDIRPVARGGERRRQRREAGTRNSASEAGAQRGRSATYQLLQKGEKGVVRGAQQGRSATYSLLREGGKVSSSAARSGDGVRLTLCCTRQRKVLSEVGAQRGWSAIYQLLHEGEKGVVSGAQQGRSATYSLLREGEEEAGAQRGRRATYQFLHEGEKGIVSGAQQGRSATYSLLREGEEGVFVSGAQRGRSATYSLLHEAEKGVVRGGRAVGTEFDLPPVAQRRERRRQRRAAGTECDILSFAQGEEGVVVSGAERGRSATYSLLHEAEKGVVRGGRAVGTEFDLPPVARRGERRRRQRGRKVSSEVGAQWVRSATYLLLHEGEKGVVVRGGRAAGTECDLPPVARGGETRRQRLARSEDKVRLTVCCVRGRNSSSEAGAQ
ncbi:hypothetical protein B0H13DRAFT_1851593 [Mycena leptocephala]|nr:hypothetical protein B0H13DRAFT_1851593 [Mycena leptocephala]